MPETIISQFQRAFNSPIEIYRQVATPTERDNIPSGVRWTGMLVYVVSDGVTYSLSGGGIDNGSWELLGGLQDAPSDGQTYGRKDGNWELIPSGGIQSVVAGDNITVDDTDPENPVVSAPDVAVKSSDSGTTGLVLEGSTSGTHTVGTQQWRWSRSGDMVCVYIILQTINGASTGTFRIDFGGTSIPSYGSNFSLLSVQAFNCPVNFYSIHGRLVNGAPNKISIGYQDALDGTNQTFITDASFSGGSFVISGTYITND